MKTKLKKLKRRYGTWEKTAEVIGITSRQLRNIRDGKQAVTKSMRIAIECLLYHG